MSAKFSHPRVFLFQNGKNNPTFALFIKKKLIIISAIWQVVFRAFIFTNNTQNVQRYTSYRVKYRPCQLRGEESRRVNSNHITFSDIIFNVFNIYFIFLWREQFVVKTVFVMFVQKAEKS